jgi:hypothetical protein
MLPVLTTGKAMQTLMRRVRFYTTYTLPSFKNLPDQMNLTGQQANLSQNITRVLTNLKMLLKKKL